MVYKPGIETSRPGKALIQARKWSVGIITASVGIGMLLSEIERVEATLTTPLTIGYLVLFATTGVLIFLWIWASSKELDLCFAWLDPERYTPPSSLRETFMIVGLGLVLSSLLFAARDPLYYAVVFTLYSAALIYTHRYTRAEVLQAINASKRRLDAELDGPDSALADEFRKGVDVLYEYFCLRPQSTRLVMIFVASLGALVAALTWHRGGSEVFGVLAYVMIGLTIGISEAVIAGWRVSRDVQLRPIEAEIAELIRRDSAHHKHGIAGTSHL